MICMLRHPITDTYECRIADGAPQPDDYVYEAHAGRRSTSGNGDGVYIYIVEEGIQVDVVNLDAEASIHRSQYLSF